MPTTIAILVWLAGLLVPALLAPSGSAFVWAGAYAAGTILTIVSLSVWTDQK